MRVLVVRPHGQALETAARLEDRGHEAVVAPVLTIVPSGLAPPAGAVDALVVTSRNAVPALRGLRGRFGTAPVFAVGERTGEALREAGFRRVTAAGGEAGVLAAAIAEHVRPGARLLHVAGRERRPEPALSLAAAGYAVAIWEAYAAEPAASLPEPARAVLAARTLDAALHYSPRSAALLRRLVGEAGLADAFGALRHLCLSRAVAGSLDRTGTFRIAVAAEPRQDRLLALLDEPAPRAD